MRHFFLIAIAASALGVLPAPAVAEDRDSLKSLRTDEERVQACLVEDDLWCALTFLDAITADKSTARPQRLLSLRRAIAIRLHLGDFTGAESDTLRALKDAPDDSELHYYLALARHEHPERALADADRAAAAATAWLRARANLLAGQLRNDIGDAAGAERSVELALKDAPQDLDALYLMIRLKRVAGESARPYAKQASRAANKAPLWRRPAALRFSARIWFELGDYDRALEDVRHALRFHPEDIDALTLAARASDKLSKKQLASLKRSAQVEHPISESAAAAADERKPLRALEANPDDLEAMRQLVVYYRSQNREDDARAYARRFADSIWNTPVWQHAEANLTLARLWLALGDAKQASIYLQRTKDLRESLEVGELIDKLDTPWDEKPWSVGLNATPLDVYCNAAELRLALGDREGAKFEIERALALDPKHEWSRRLAETLKIPLPAGGGGH